MHIQINIQGTSPLLMHSDAGVNPEHPLCREKAVITSKHSSKQTAEDHREIRRLDWLIGLYHQDGEVIYPTANVVRCIKEAGKVTKQGTQVSRGLSFDGVSVPLIYNRNGHNTLEDLYGDANFVDERSVGVGQKRIMRTRPRFMPWAIAITGYLFDDVMDVTDLRRVAELAGRAVGLGDNRINGFGRFTVDIKEV